MVADAVVELARLLVEGELRRPADAALITTAQYRYLLHLRRRVGRAAWVDARRRLGLSGRRTLGLSRREASRLIDELVAEVRDGS